MRFDDRRSAGRVLGRAVADLDPVNPVVLALPRGGVPVGFEVARVLDCGLDILVVRKIGAPHQEELAMGAIAEAGVVIRNADVIGLLGVEDDVFDRVVERERQELERRISAYRGDAPATDPSGRTAIVVDDGLATGATAMAGVEVLRQRGASEVWVAVPVAPPDTSEVLAEVADRLVVVHTPVHFGAVGAWYRDFTQTSDDEVRGLLNATVRPDE